MKNIIISLLFNIICNYAKAQSQRIEFEAPERYPEGVTYDARSDLFYVSGVRLGTVGSVDKSGKYTEIFSDSTVKSAYGLKVSRNHLLICCGDANYSKFSNESTHKKTAWLISIDLTDKTKRTQTDLGKLFNGKHFANDVAVDDKGNAFITDSYSPVIYKISSDGNAAIFSESDLYKSKGVGLNGIAWHPDGYLLVDNGGTGAVLKVSADGKTITKVKMPQFFSGADGLLLDENKDLVLVQNKGVNRVFKLHSTDSWKTASVIAATQTTDIFSNPSTAAMCGKEVWVMNAKLNELSEENTIPSKKFSLQKANFVEMK